MNPSWQDLFSLPPEKRQNHRIHLIGIGGTGLAPIAKVLIEMGYQVSGSDLQDSPRTAMMRSLGAGVQIGHSADNLRKDYPPVLPDLILMSSAIPEENAEVISGRGADIAVVKRNDLLGPLTAGRRVIAIAGTHGKTTTTAMLAQIMVGAGRDPGYIIGSDVADLGFSAAGSEDYFIIEADEYDYAFLGLTPEIIVLTSLDWDHPDCFPNQEAYTEAFRTFIKRIQPRGSIVYCFDDAHLHELSHEMAAAAQWYGYGNRTTAPWYANNIEINSGSTRFTLRTPSGQHHAFELAVPGLHNVLNSVGAILAASLAGVPIAECIRPLAEYRGAARRFEIKGTVGDVIIVDDYAHHPTEIRTTLAAARAAYPDREIWAVYQPHTYSRTRTFLEQYEGVFAAADHLLITNIYAAREPRDPAITPEQIIAASRHHTGFAPGDVREVGDYLLEHLCPNSVVIILSAGSATELAPYVLKNYKPVPTL